MNWVKSIVGISFLMLFTATTLLAQNKQAYWIPNKSQFVAKSAYALVVYNSTDVKKVDQHKYKLFDVATGNVALELSGFDYLAYKNRFMVYGSNSAEVYDVVGNTTTKVAEFGTKALYSKNINEVEVVGFSKNHWPIFRVVGQEIPDYFIYNLTLKNLRKLKMPANTYSMTFNPTTGDFSYIKQDNGKYLCQRFNPENEGVVTAGFINTIPDATPGNIKLSPTNQYVIYADKQVYNPKTGEFLYDLPKTNENLIWQGDRFDFTGVRVACQFSENGDSLIVIRKMKKEVGATETVNVEIVNTKTNTPLKTFYLMIPSAALVDTDVASGWAAFLGEGKVKIVHLTSKSILREFTLHTPDLEVPELGEMAEVPSY